MSPEIVTPRGRELERASAADVAGIVAIETDSAMTNFIGSWPAERHLRNLADRDYHYLVARDADGDVDGFAIVTPYSPKFHWFELNRIAVREPGRGVGADLLAGVISYTFDRVHAHRLQLDVYEDNIRARRAYERAGFRFEGVMRDAVTRDGVWVPLVLMALLENERVS